MSADPLEAEGKTADGHGSTPNTWKRKELGLITCGIIVRKLSDALAQVRDEQSYIVVRERVHRNTAESTNGRVKWWSVFQLAVVIGEGVFQVWWLKRFFEVSL